MSTLSTTNMENETKTKYPKALSFRPNKETDRRIAKLLKRTGMSASDFLRRAVEAHLPELEAK